MKQIDQKLIDKVKDVCLENSVVVELYDLPINNSEYNYKHRIMELCEVSSGDVSIDCAVVYHEIAHVLQDREGYLPMRLTKQPFLRKIFWYWVEVNATDRANKLMDKEVESIFTVALAKVYLKDQLKKYRKQIFGF